MHIAHDLIAYQTQRKRQMTLRLGVAAIGLLLSGSVFSAVTITAPEEIVILAVNGQEVNSGLFRSSKNNYKVDAGETSLSVRYQEYFEHLSGEHDIVKSGVVTAPRPIIKSSQPDCCWQALASALVQISPLAITLIFKASLIGRIFSQ